MSPHHLEYTKHFRQGVTVFEVDIDKSLWFGDKVRELGAYGRRRFENWIILERPKERIKVIYT